MRLAYGKYLRPLRFLILYLATCVLIFKGVVLCEAWHNAHKFGVRFRVAQEFQQRYVDLSDVIGKQRAGQFAYRYRPPPMMAAYRSIPLVVFLHGAGERGDDNFQQLRLVPTELCAPSIANKFPCSVLVPQCPKGSSWSSRLSADITIIDLLEYMCDEVLQDTRIDPHRIYLIGYSMGGLGAWSWAALSPGRFAAIVPIAGGGDPSTGPTFVDLPVWAVHGAADGVVAVEQTRAIIGAIREAGGKPKYSEVVGMGHDSWRELIDNDFTILRWLFSQKREQIIGGNLNLQSVE